MSIRLHRRRRVEETTESRQVLLSSGETLLYRGIEIPTEMLDAVLESGSKRVLWAFVRGENKDIMAVPYDEEHVIWMAESDVVRPEDVEV